MRVRELVPVFRQPRMGGQFREALRYAHRKPTIFWPIVLLAFVATFGMNLPVLFTASANETYGTGPEGYGLYSSLAAVGAVVGAIIASRRRSLRLRSIVFATIVYGVITALAGLTVWYPLFLGLLVGIGISRLLFALSAEAMTQLSTNPGIRGRIMAIYLTVAVGGQAAGGVIIGWVAETFGSTVAFLVAGWRAGDRGHRGRHHRRPPAPDAHQGRPAHAAHDGADRAARSGHPRGLVRASADPAPAPVSRGAASRTGRCPARRPGRLARRRRRR